MSGIDHQFAALAVDDPGKRLILFSVDPDPRVAALTQVDVQATMPGTRVLVARPLSIDLGFLARNFRDKIGASGIDVPSVVDSFQRVAKRPMEVQKRAQRLAMSRFERGGFAAMMEAFQQTSSPVVSQLVAVTQQLALLDWQNILAMVGRDQGSGFISVDALLTMDTLAIDRRHGVCPIPFYELQSSEWEMLRSEDVRDAKELLLKLGVFEYFFPAADELRLGLIEQGVNDRARLEAAVRLTDQSGHIPGHATIVDEQDPMAIISALEEVGYVAEGEFGFEVTPDGRSFRSTVRYRPKESVFSRILNRISINASVSPSDF
ncbi:hypothetical protein H9Q09_01265 [Aurantimonas sp. DM33-3]|nr:hypothetical protein [Aurantimonas sp. DM33-3]